MTTSSCIFCKIVAREIPAAIVYKDDHTTAFRDIHPVAPTHVLIIPNRHIESVDQATAEDEKLLGHLLIVAQKVAQIEGIQQSGYRLIINNGVNAGQEVLHIHVHVIGGTKLGRLIPDLFSGGGNEPS